ncbi:VENN motif pre-toxin domain-containing protein [Acinetobacter faecalis]|uniref:VENN motif pre-toxin domain-containing protein n=1 Tax=Acinetobacter faecalis TaxID=2665161 RepID=UPI002A914CF6|nr:VENN motif pre-toxin domain-containing protein [Acinetobacter faecalis]MDY6457540.1 VENN motif pre-toxin domain-containing protein [Acinetobacter faecalis]MDY6468348.1 VENN motif pre-toxin domain-containing protein [Acinetobacter faecalis]
MVAHALLGATLAYINGGDPTAGGSAAVASEAAAMYFTNQYKDKKEYQDENGEFQPNLLPEDVKAQIRDLTAGIGAVIGGAVGDSSYNAQLAGVIGQNATENNEMGIFPVNSELMQSADSLARDLSNKNVDPITTQKVMCAEITGHFHLGDSRQPTCKSPLPFDLAF